MEGSLHNRTQHLKGCDILEAEEGPLSVMWHKISGDELKTNEDIDEFIIREAS